MGARRAPYGLSPVHDKCGRLWLGALRAHFDPSFLLLSHEQNPQSWEFFFASPLPINGSKSGGDREIFGKKIFFSVVKNRVLVKKYFSQNFTISPNFFFGGGGGYKIRLRRDATPSNCQNQFLEFLKKR